MAAPQYGQWLNILKWSLQQSDGTTDSVAEAMSNEKKEWLMTAMKELVKNEASRLLVICEELVSVIDAGSIDGTINSNVCDLLNELRDIVEQIDMAQIVVKYGGIKCLLRISKCSDFEEETRSLAVSVIGSTSQNNATVQAELFSQNTIHELVSIFMGTESLLIKNKALFALSCSIRSYHPSEQLFVTSFAYVLQESLNSSHIQLQRRAMFLSSALIHSDVASMDNIRSILDVISPTLLSLQTLEDVELRESAISIILYLLQFKFHFLTTYKDDFLELLKDSICLSLDLVRSRTSLVEVDVVNDDDLASDIREKDHLSAILSMITNILEFGAPLPNPPSSTQIHFDDATNRSPSMNDVTVPTVGDEPMLLIAPPALSAASAAP